MAQLGKTVFQAAAACLRVRHGTVAALQNEEEFDAVDDIRIHPTNEGLLQVCLLLRNGTVIWGLQACSCIDCAVAWVLCCGPVRSKGSFLPVQHCWRARLAGMSRDVALSKTWRTCLCADFVCGAFGGCAVLCCRWCWMRPSLTW